MANIEWARSKDGYVESAVFTDDRIMRIGIGKAMVDGIYDVLNNTGRFIVADWSA